MKALVDEYALVHALKASTEYQLRRTVQLFCDFLGREARPSDLTDAVVSRWLAQLQETHAQRTVAGHRTNMLSLWRDAAGQGLCAPPHRVRRVPRPDPCPIAWTWDELLALAQACGDEPGKLAGDIPRSLYFSTLFKAAYESGLRRSDLWVVRREQIRPDGAIVMRQAKTGRTHHPRLRDDTLQAIAALPGRKPLAWPYQSASYFYVLWERVVQRAGVRHGALQQIRRTGATHLAINHPDAVQRYLGHRTADMQRHYVDQSIANPQQHLPPPIDM